MAAAATAGASASGFHRSPTVGYVSDAEVYCSTLTSTCAAEGVAHTQQQCCCTVSSCQLSSIQPVCGQAFGLSSLLVRALSIHRWCGMIAPLKSACWRMCLRHPRCVVQNRGGLQTHSPFVPAPRAPQPATAAAGMPCRRDLLTHHPPTPGPSPASPEPPRTPGTCAAGQG